MRAHSEINGGIAIAAGHRRDGFVGHDADRRRVRARGKCLRRGLVAAPFAGIGIAGVAAHRLTARGGVERALPESVLMAHDRHDRSLWFRRDAEEDWD